MKTNKKKNPRISKPMKLEDIPGMTPAGIAFSKWVLTDVMDLLGLKSK